METQRPPPQNLGVMTPNHPRIDATDVQYLAAVFIHIFQHSDSKPR